jgi:hypothetical protein
VDAGFNSSSESSKASASSGSERWVQSPFTLTKPTIALAASANTAGAGRIPPPLPFNVGVVVVN